MSDSSEPRGSDPNREGPGEPRVDELAQLARRAPDKIRDHLEKLPLARQAEIAAQLPARERLELLLHAPLPMRLVRTLPDGDLYLTIREVGPADALPLLALASAPQLLHLIDLESWRRDEFDPGRSGAWIALCVALLVGTAFLCVVPSVSVALAGGVMSAGVIGNLVSARWDGNWVPNPLIVDHGGFTVAFNLADVFFLVGNLLLMATLAAEVVRHRDRLALAHRRVGRD